MRIRAIDWVRGLVVMLMTIDHAGAIFDSAHMHGDTARTWVVGSALPAGEFLTRWITHLCAPTFVLLAGASLALSAEKRRDDPNMTRFIVTRGLFIAALDPAWMSLGFAKYHLFIFQVLYAIGMSMVCMAWLRRLRTPVLLGIAVAIQLLGELSAQWQPDAQPLHTIWACLWVAGPATDSLRVGYPLLPWLSIMIFGWVLGRWLLVPRPNAARARTLALVGGALLAAFLLVRGIDGYGNWNLHRDSADALQWLHVSKYPPCIAFTTLELGIAFLLLAAFTALDDPRAPRRAFAVFSLFGATAFFYYIWHVHLLLLVHELSGLSPDTDGLAQTWLATLLPLVVLAWPCVLYRRYKRAHPDSWTRYL